MASQWQDVQTKPASGGIDSYSARAKIRDGYVEDAINMDCDANGKYSARVGYENYYGYLPLRASRFEQDAYTIKLFFDSNVAIDLTSTPAGPLVVYGTLPPATTYSGSTFGSTAAGKYFTSYTIESSEILTGDSTSRTSVRTAASTGISSKYVFMGTLQVVAPAPSNTTLEMESISISATTFDVTMGYTFTSNTSVYFMFLQKDAVTASTYIYTATSDTEIVTGSNSGGHIMLTTASMSFSDGDVVRITSTGDIPNSLTLLVDYYVRDRSATTCKLALTAGGSAISYGGAPGTPGTGTITLTKQGQTFSIPAATHNLNSVHIGVKIFNDVSNVVTELVASEVTLNTSGDVTFTVSGSITGHAILTTLPNANTSTSSAVLGSNTFTITGIASPYCFYYIYASTGIGTYVQVVPESISYNHATTTTTITYLVAASSETVEVWWEEATIVGNVISLTDSGSASPTLALANPSITVWGIGHKTIYRDGTPRGGWVHALDNYKSSLTESLVAGCGGALFSAMPRASAVTAALMPNLYGHLRARTTAEKVVGPLFSTASTARTRGSVYDASITSGGLATVTDITYVSTGFVDLTLSFTSKTGTISTSIDTTTGSADRIVVSANENPLNTGTFIISSVVAESATSATIRVINSAAVSTQVNEVGISGKAGVFTDILAVDNGRFIAGDIITYDNAAANYTIVALRSSTLILINTTTLVTISSSILMYGTRTSRIIPTRDGGGTATVTNYVIGDTLSVPFVTNKPTVLNVAAAASTALTSIVTTGTVATVTFSGNHTYNAGGYISIYGDVNNLLNGEWLIASVPSATTLTFATTVAAATYTGCYNLGYSVELDESLEWYDSAAVTTMGVVGRWWPLDAPPRGAAIGVLDTATSPLGANDYSNQPITSSVGMRDSLYFTNGDDTILKYDGTYLYEAGLRRITPSVFMGLDTSVASIQADQAVSYTTVNTTGKSFLLANDAFAVGDYVYDSNTAKVFLIVEKQTATASGSTTFRVVVAGDTSTLSNTGTLTKAKRFRYYFRFNMIDRNNNLIAGNAASSNDCYFDLFVAGRIRIKTSYYPTLRTADYDRIELEIYRTKSNQKAPFYLTKRIALNFATLNAIDVVDDNDDDFLTQLDVVHSSLLGQEIGTAWQPPFRAKCITTANNSLIISNLKGWPEFDLTMKPTTSLLTAMTLNGFSFLFRKDNTDTTTTSDFQTVQKFEYKSTGATTISGPVTFTFAHTAVDNANDWVDGVTHGMTTGDRFKTTTTSAPSGITPGDIYWAIVLSSTRFAYASSLANAIAGTKIAIAQGSAGTASAQSDGCRQSDTTIYLASGAPATNSWIYLFYPAVGTNYNFGFAGWFQVTTASMTGGYIMTLQGYGFTITPTFGTSFPTRFITATTTSDIPVWIGTDGNYNQVGGNVIGQSVEIIAATRLADAINFTHTYSKYMNKINYPNFEKWLIARSGEDFGVGQITMDVPENISTTVEVVIGTIPTGLNVFIHGLNRSSAEQVSTTTQLFPSRVGISFKNYPEMFDNLTSTQIYSRSVVDINPADGQEITCAIPFFGESTFGAAALNQVVAIFKPNSIYVLDIESRQYQRIDSRGIGCSAPKSVTSTKDGIMFINHGGIYRLNTQMKVDYVGRFMKGKWDALVNHDLTDIAGASHWGHKSQYKVFLPPLAAAASSDTYPTQAFVYNYDNEEVGERGSWTRYTDMAALLGCNQDDYNFFASVNGCVYWNRSYDGAVDYRDDASAIPATLLFRADDFGVPSSRKSVYRAVVQIDATATTLTNVTMSVATNLSTTYTTVATMSFATSDGNVTVEASPADKKGVHFQVKMVHSAIDEQLSVIGLGYEVAKLTFKGVAQSADYS